MQDKGAPIEFTELLTAFKEKKGWSWERFAHEINEIQGGSKGVTGPTLFRYAKGSSRPRNEMLKQYVLAAIDQLDAPHGSVLPQPDERSLTPKEDLSASKRGTYYQDFYQRSPVMMHSVGQDGRLLSVNQFWLDKMGYEWHEVIGRRSTDFLTAESRQLVQDLYWPEFMRVGEVTDIPLQFVRKDGEVLEVLLSAKTSWDEAEDLDFTFAVLVDVTGIKRESIELQAWKSLVENAPDFILTIARDGAIMYCNKILPGFSREDVIGKSVYSFVDAKYSEQYKQAIERAFLTGESHVIQVLGQGANLEPAWYEAHIGALEHNGKIIAATIISSDITDRKQSERHFRMLFEQNISGVFRSSLDGRLLDCNDAFAEILGYESRSALIDGPVHDFYHDPQDRDSYINELLRSGSVKNFEIRHKKRDGSAVWVLANSSLVQGEDGQDSVILGTLLDVTGKKQLEERLLQQNEYLIALHDTALGVISHMALDELLEAIITRAGSLVGSLNGFIYLTDSTSDEMSVDYAVGELRQFIGATTRLGEGLAGRVWHTGRAMVIDDYHNWDGRLDVRDYDNFKSIIGVPLKSGHRVIGVLGLVHLNEKLKFGQPEIAILTQFAELASIALDNVRLYEQLQAQLEQGNEAIQNLKADVEVSLTAIALESEKILSQPNDAEAALSHSKSINERAQTALQSLHRLPTD